MKYKSFSNNYSNGNLAEFTVYDLDFHDVHSERRLNGTHECQAVHIGINVFIGSRVTILKGVTIGNNGVFGSGAVISKSVPENCIVGGTSTRFL